MVSARMSQVGSVAPVGFGDWLHAMVEDWQIRMSTERKADVLARMGIIVNLQPSKANIHIIEYFGHCMKKGFFVAGIILLVGLAAIYLSIPSRLNVVVV